MRQRRADAARRSEAQRLSDALNAQGIPACASMHAQGQGLCIQILLKMNVFRRKAGKTPAQVEKERKTIGQ